MLVAHGNSVAGLIGRGSDYQTGDLEDFDFGGSVELASDFFLSSRFEMELAESFEFDIVD